MKPEEALLCASSGPEWLVATFDRFFVVDPEYGREPVHSLRFEEVQGFRIVQAVGSGLLQVRVDGVWVDFMRFSNRMRGPMEKSVRDLEAIARGERPAEQESGEPDPSRCAKCGMAIEVAGDPCPRCIDHGAAVGRILGMMRPYFRPAAVMMALLLVGIALDMAWPLLTQYLVDHVLAPPGQEKELTRAARFLAGVPPKRQLVFVVVALACVHLVRGALNVVTGWISSRVSNALTFDVRGKLVRKAQQLGLAYYSKQETGALVGRITYDTEAIQGFIGQVTSGFFMQFLLVILSLGMMFALEPRLALWAMVPAPFVIGGAFIYWRFVHPHFQRYWDRTSKQAGLLNGILSGIRVVKAFAQEDNEFNRFQKCSMDVRKTKETVDRTSAYFYPLMSIVFQVGGWIIWYVGGKSVLDGNVSLGTLMAFFGYLSMFYGPLGNLTNLTTWLTQFSTQMHRIFELLDTPAALTEAEKPSAAPAARGEIEFRNVRFSYAKGAPVLRDLSLRIQPGERIGIVGRSGSGKTSIINLICRFYDPDSGQVLLDGVDVRDISKEDLRKRISIVLQEPFLFRGTLWENISYGRPGAEVADILQASRAANSHEFIMKHALGYDTSVGERGQELSGGERQRVSIARAFLCSPPVLILDEATSSVDSDSEQAIQASFEELGKGRTTIVIAHRLSTLRNCDRIYVIESGEIAESGSHQELMRSDGRYAKWVRIQEGGARVDPDVVAEERVPEAPSTVPAESIRTRWLSPETDRIERGSRGELRIRLRDGHECRGAFALRCFPVRFPEQYISLRYVDQQNQIREIGIIGNLSDWNEESRELVRESLDRRYLFQKIERIHSIRKFSHFLAFSAKTDMGRVEFIMRQAPDAAKAYGNSGRLLVDVEDNFYVIPDVQRMPRVDREVFDRYVYW